MTDVLHEKFAQLMDEVETLEEQVAAAEKEGVDDALLLEMKNKLAEARNRLAQLSDGCGTGHSHTV
jgi:ribosome-interacting GTPase 1